MRQLPLNVSAQVPLSGFPAASGSVMSPPDFTILATTPVLQPGTYLVEWTVTLAGTLSSADANNFSLVDQIVPASTPVGGNASSYNFLVQSVNTDTAGSYPQTAYSLTLAAPTQLGIAAATTTPTTGAVYSASVSCSGIVGAGTASIGPQSPGEIWDDVTAAVRVATNVDEAICSIYSGAGVAAGYFRGATTWGSTGDSTSQVPQVRVGGQVFAVWTWGDAGQVATLTVTGTKTVR
jgi:hypothetical protein